MELIRFLVFPNREHWVFFFLIISMTENKQVVLNYFVAIVHFHCSVIQAILCSLFLFFLYLLPTRRSTCLGQLECQSSGGLDLTKSNVLLQFLHIHPPPPPPPKTTPDMLTSSTICLPSCQLSKSCVSFTSVCGAFRGRPNHIQILGF